MEIVYSDHAKKRMKQRGIEDWEIEHALKFPSHIKKFSNGKREAITEVGNRKIGIIFIKFENYIKIVPVY